MVNKNIYSITLCILIILISNLFIFEDIYYIIIDNVCIGILSYNLIKFIMKNNAVLYTRNRVIKNYRCYSTKINNDYLDPWFVTGFSDGEGCFNISITKSKSNIIGWQVQIRFIIELNIKDIDILYKIQNFFGGIGKITFTQKVARFAVFGINDIMIILNHFDNYPLQSAKQRDFYLWKESINIILNKDHLTQKGLEKIVSYKCAMNFSKSDNLMLSFPNITLLEKPILDIDDKPLNPFWVTGFMEADGSFFININKITNKVRPVASIGLNDREKFLLEKINKFFNEIGSVYESPKHNFAEWKVFKLTNLEYLINHFNNYPLKGFKSYNFSIWCEIIKLIKNKDQLSQKDLDNIKILKEKLNKWN